MTISFFCELNKIYFKIVIDFNKINAIINFIKINMKGGLKWK